MRAAVGHITRNIKIKGSTDSSWGCRVLVYAYKAGDDTILRGYTKLSGVEFENCG